MTLLRNSIRSIAAIVAFVLVLGATPAWAAATLGFVEDWVGGFSSWGGGVTLANPGTGGVDGDDDGYLILSTSVPTGKLASVSMGPEYEGNWIAAGITRLRLSLNDVGADEPLQIHVCIGNGSNFWEYNTAFSPPNQSWGEFVVDLSTAANFTRIIGSGSFETALQNVDRIQIRHDLPPLTQSPDGIQGDVGVDHLMLTNTDPTPIRASTWGRIKALYR